MALPNYGPLAGPDSLVRLAQRAEELGADGIWVSDHLVAPVDARSVYPYGPPAAARGPTRLGIIEEFYEPLVTLAFLAGHTRTVRLGVSAYVLPYRNPVLTAKHVATLDALSSGRVVLAVGTGWLREEFAALDVPFAGRGQPHRGLSRGLSRPLGGRRRDVRRGGLPSPTGANRTSARSATASSHLDRGQLAGRPGAGGAPRGRLARHRSHPRGAGGARGPSP